MKPVNTLWARPRIPGSHLLSVPRQPHWMAILPEWICRFNSNRRAIMAYESHFGYQWKFWPYTHWRVWILLFPKYTVTWVNDFCPLGKELAEFQQNIIAMDLQSSSEATLSAFGVLGLRTDSSVETWQSNMNFNLRGFLQPSYHSSLIFFLM